MITYASRKRTFATYVEDHESEPALSSPRPPNAKPLQAISGNASQLPTPPASDDLDTQAKWVKITEKPASPANASPTPDSPPSSPSTTISHAPKSIRTLLSSSSRVKSDDKPPPKRRKLTQMTIDLGGPVQIRCKTCGMEYIPSAAEDQALHARYHAAMTKGVDVGGSMLKGGVRIVARIQRDHGRGRNDKDEKDQVIVEVTRWDKAWAKRAASNVLEVVEKELGAVRTREEELWGVATGTIPEGRQSDTEAAAFKVYLSIRGTKCIGLLLAQRILSARRMDAACSISTLDTTTDAGEQHGARSDDAPLGVSRIWVSKEYRGRGIAIQLLDAACKGFVHAIELGKDEVAFSQPTEAGLKLIRRWVGVKKEGDENAAWLMYDEEDVHT